MNSAAAKAAREARHARKIASPQWKDGKFQNGLPEVTRFADALRKMIFSGAKTTPDETIPTIEKSAPISTHRVNQDFASRG